MFCGAGGAATGFLKARAEVVGVDAEPQPLYPGEMVMDDVLVVLGQYAPSVDDGTGFDLLYASPPSRWAKIPALREALERTEVPYVLENVEDSGLRDPVRFCGTADAFAQGWTWHRSYETNWPLPSPGECCHPRKPAFMALRNYADDTERIARTLGLHGFARDQLAQATPPIFARYIADAFARSLTST